MTKREVFETAGRQLSLDYCCRPEDFVPGKVMFTEYTPLPGRRMFEDEPRLMRLCVFGGGAVFTANKELLPTLEEKFAGDQPEWIMDGENVAFMNSLLKPFDGVSEKCHLFFLPDPERMAARNVTDVRWFEREELEQFRGTGWDGEALGFIDRAPDMLAVAACDNGEIVGMAGASADSDAMWQIGVEILPEHRGKGLAAGLVSMLANETLRRGKIPYYGTAVSHVGSQAVAQAAGFVPAWAELTTRYSKKA